MLIKIPSLDPDNQPVSAWELKATLPEGAEEITSAEALMEAYCQGRRNFSGVQLDEGDFQGAELPGINLSHALLQRCNFAQANLAEACFNLADCQQANFRGANLSGADLTEAKLDSACLEQATLVDAELTYGYLPRACLDHAVMENVCLEGAELSQASLQGCDLTAVDFGGARLHYAKFNGALLRRANLMAQLEYADFSKADLRQTQLAQVDLTNVLLRGTDLRNTGVADNKTADLRDAIWQQVDSATPEWKKLAEWQGDEFSSFDVDETWERLAYGCDGGIAIASIAPNAQPSQTLNFEDETVLSKFVVSVAFDETQNKLYNCIYLNDLVVWDLAPSQQDSPQPIYNLTAVPGAVSALWVDRKGQDVAVLTPAEQHGNEPLVTFDAEQRSCPGGGRTIRSRAVSSDGKYLAESGFDPVMGVRVIEVESQACIHLIQHENPVQSLCFSPDGCRLASMSAAETVVWNLESKLEEERDVLSGWNWRNIWAPRPHFIADQAGADRLLSEQSHITRGISLGTPGRSKAQGLCWNVEGSHQSAGSEEFYLSGDRTKAAQKFQDRSVQIWDLHSGELLNSILFETNKETLLGLNRSGSQMLTARGARVKLWNVTSGEILKTFDNKRARAYDAIFSHGDQRIIAGSDDGTIRLWEIETGRELHTFRSFDEAFGLAVDEGDRLLLSSNNQREIVVWDLERYEEWFRFKPEPEADWRGCIVKQIFRPGHRQVMSCTRNGKVIWWQLPER